MNSIKNLFAALLCGFYLDQGNGSNILAVLPIPLDMYTNSYMHILKELARRGHNVTVLSPFPQSEDIPNFNEIIISDTLGQFLRETHEREIKSMSVAWFTIFGFRYFCKIMVDEVIKLPELKAFLNESSSRYDLLILEAFRCQEPFLALSHKYGVPVVSFLASQDLSSSVSDITANAYSSAYIPNHKFPFRDRMNFWERLTNLIMNTLELVVDKINWIYMDMYMRSHFVYSGFENLPPLSNMMRNISLFLIDSHIALSYPRPYLPNMIEFGGIFNRSATKLPQDLDKFLNESTDGIILLSWGQIHLSFFSQTFHSVYLPVFAKLKQRVLIKWDDKEVHGKPENVMIRSDVDHESVLAHPNTRLFITHGGFHSIVASIYHGVPILGTPIFGSNIRNMLIIEEEGIGLSLDLNILTQKTFKKALDDLVYNSSYKENAMRRSRILRDRPMEALEHAVYWIEYVLRYKGAYHLQPATLELPWYQYWPLDILAVFGGIFCGVLVIASHLLGYICQWVTKPVQYFKIKRNQANM